MRSIKKRTADKKRVQEKLDLVIEKLMNLGGPENGEELAEGGEAIGFFKRDFGIREWDWPQGVGLYGLLRIMQARKNEGRPPLKKYQYHHAPSHPGRA